MDSGRRRILRLDDPASQRILDRLARLVGEGPAEYFADACRLMQNGDDFHTRSHLVAHLLREIEGGIRAALKIAASDRKAESRSNEEHRRQIVEISAALGFNESESFVQFWLGLAGKGSGALVGRAHRRGLGRPRPVDADFQSFWDGMLVVLDRILGAFETRYVSVFKALDELLLVDAPTRKDIERLEQAIPNTSTAHRYFFSRLQHPAWLPLLHEAGFFRQVPEVIIDEQNSTMSFAHWPQVEYLARMAANASSDKPLLCEILAGVPDTENAVVDRELLSISCRLPPGDVVSWAERKIKWVSEQPRVNIILADRYVELANHLATGGQVAVAVRLLEKLLAILPGQTRNPQEQAEEGTLPPEPGARLEDLGYHTVLKDTLPVLFQVAPQASFELACRLLRDYVRLSTNTKLREVGEDGSSIWRRAIEDHAQNRRHGIGDLLVSAVRDAAMNVCHADPSRVAPVISHLEDHASRIFRRIALHILRQLPQFGRPEIARCLTNQALINDVDHEFYLLLGQEFPNLQPAEQQTILEAIEAGPTTEHHNPDYWRYRRLAAIEPHLTGERRTQWDALVTKYGPPKHPDFESWREGWVGPTSPRTANELAAMSVGDVIEYLRTWEPPADEWEASRDGLARTVTECVAQAPDRFASVAQEFTSLQPVYVLGLIRGFQEAVEQERAFSWDNVLELCRWASSQQDARDKLHPATASWTWVKQGIASLLDTALESQACPIPFALRDAVWSVIESLTHDPDPAAVLERTETGGFQDDPVQRALNCVRGRAMHAVVHYAIWVNRQLAASMDKTQVNLAAMPEVRRALEERLDLAHEPTLAIRSIYGLYLPQLHAIDSAWLTSNLSAIFPSDPEFAAYHAAAWDAYVSWCRPYSALLDVLRDEYKRAVDNVSPVLPTGHVDTDPMVQLGEHLMAFYLQGLLELTDGGLVNRFFASAHDEVRGAVIGGIGEVLRRSENVPQAQLDSLRKFWEWRVQAGKTAEDIAMLQKEMAAFGGWFTSSCFDEMWSLDQLKTVLSLVGNAEPNRHVLRRLAELAPAHPASTVRCLEMLIEGSERHPDQWRLEAWRDEARSILRSAISSQDDEARRAGSALINRLMSRGHLHYRELLP